MCCFEFTGRCFVFVCWHLQQCKRNARILSHIRALLLHLNYCVSDRRYFGSDIETTDPIWQALMPRTETTTHKEPATAALVEENGRCFLIRHRIKQEKMSWHSSWLMDGAFEISIVDPRGPTRSNVIRTQCVSLPRPYQGQGQDQDQDQDKCECQHHARVHIEF